MELVADDILDVRSRREETSQETLRRIM
jgi:hypothetical protein